MGILLCRETLYNNPLFRIVVLLRLFCWVILGSVNAGIRIVVGVVVGFWLWEAGYWQLRVGVFF